MSASTGERIRKALASRGITNGRKLAEYLGSRGVIFFGQGAELRFQEDGEERRLTYPPTGDATTIRERRQQCVERAMADGWERLGVDSWSRAPFSNCWLPSEDVARVHREFDPGA